VDKIVKVNVLMETPNAESTAFTVYSTHCSAKATNTGYIRRTTAAWKSL